MLSTIKTNSSKINKSNEKLVKIPRRAVFNENKAFTIDSVNKLEIKTLNIISYQDDFVVVDNLKNGTIVVKEPLIGESEGTKVKVILKWED